ncbi:unnamed protein product [Diamesa serratosioi]
MPGIIDRSTCDADKHSGDVTSIVYQNGNLFSAGGDGKIKIWNADLKLKKELNIHEAHVYAIAMDKQGKLYSSSCDGTIKTMENPLENDKASILLLHDNEIEALFVDDHLNFYCGDDKGGVTCFSNGKLKYQINIVEGVKSLFVENNLVYTLLNMDLSIHELRDNGKYIMKTSIPGKFPVTLFGKKEDTISQFIAILTRDGKGITIVKNNTTERFATLTVKENVHEMIINAMTGCGNILYSCDYAGVLKRLQVDDNELKELDKISIESGCANCLALMDDKTVFVGSTDGSIKKIIFN